MGNYYSGMMNNKDGYGELKHFGILGMKWGVRRFQNADGSLTPAGKERYYGKIEISSRDRNKLIKMINARPRNVKSIKNLPFIQDAAKTLSEEGKRAADASKEFDTVQDELDHYIFDNPRRYDKWVNRAVDNFMKNENSDESMGTRDEIYDWFRNEDGDQNGRGTIETYLRESEEPMAKRYLDIEKKYAKASSDLRKKADSISNDILGAGPDSNMNKFWTSVFIQDAAKEYASSGESIPKSGMAKRSLFGRVSDLYNGRTSGETDSTKVKDLLLRRQMENNIRQNTKLQDNWDFRGKSAREERDLTKKFIKTSVKKFNETPGYKPERWRTAKADTDKYMREVAKIRLESMGYDVTNKAIDNLVSKDWFKNSLWIRNTLASMGADGVDFTSEGDMKFR